MVATAKPCEVYTVFAWQVMFQGGVYGEWPGPKQRDGLGAIECFLSVCGCRGMRCQGVVAGSTVLFGRDGQLSGEGGQVAICVPELSGGCVEDDWGILLKCICVPLMRMCCRKGRARVS